MFEGIVEYSHIGDKVSQRIFLSIGDLEYIESYMHLQTSMQSPEKSISQHLKVISIRNLQYVSSSQDGGVVRFISHITPILKTTYVYLITGFCVIIFHCITLKD